MQFALQFRDDPEHDRFRTLAAELQPHRGVQPAGERGALLLCKSREQCVSPIRDSVRSDIISHMSDIAIRLKRKITWDPQKEQIVGDTEATKMLSRPLRAPWTI